jgi:hypothetical protein
MILDFSSLIGARGATNQLHELVFQSCYVCHLYGLTFLYFEIFAWMNYMIGIRDYVNVFMINVK